MSDSSMKFVDYALSIRAIELLPEGRKLKSGRISPYFFNSGLFNTGRSITHLAKAYVAAAMGNFAFDIVYGPAYKGIPLATVVAMVFYTDWEVDISYAFNRKEAKDHGEGGIIVGVSSLQGKKVLIVDDVMTTGTSSGEAVEIIRASGGIPIGCVIAFDRQERGKESDLSAVQEFQKNYGIPVQAAATLDDLILVLADKGSESSNQYSTAVLEKILDYKVQYGVTQ